MVPNRAKGLICIDFEFVIEKKDINLFSTETLINL